MTAPGYLDRLAARARGAVAGVRPRVPGRFEPPRAADVPDLEVVEETAAGSAWPTPQPAPDGPPRSGRSQVVAGAGVAAAPRPSRAERADPWDGPRTGTLGPAAGQATESARPVDRIADPARAVERTAPPAGQPAPRREAARRAAAPPPALEAPADPLAVTPVPSWVEDRPAATPPAHGAPPERVDGNAPPAAPPPRAVARRAAMPAEPAPPASAPRDAAAAWAGPVPQAPVEAPAPTAAPRVERAPDRPPEVALREVTVRPEVTGPAPAPVAAETAAEVPVIEVTIGRVEVRAAPGRDHPRRRASGRERPPMPLDEYLRRRSGRR
jgi:hypothetical protein